MSSNQSAKYKKFIVGAASAALVASAVAPVASAKDFKDTKGNTHETAIDALSDAGVITGYPNGTFLPNKTLTRSDVVKLMGKWLVSEGYKVPTDYKTKMRFSDLTSKSNDELLQYAAVVKDNGVFNGSNGNLLAGDNITRENMAVVIVRAFDTVKDIELVKYVKEQDFKKDVTDLTKAKAEARTAIDVLDYFDITNPAAPAFNPKNTTTRGHFATFLHKSINTDFSEVKAPVVDVDKVAVDAAAEQVKAGAVTVARGNYATDANKLAAVEAYVTSLVTEKDVVAKVAAGKTAGEYVVTLTKGEAKVDKTIAMTFEFAADDRFVTEVNALNATQVEVKFSTAVDAKSVLDADNALKANTISLTSLDGLNAGSLKGELSKDGKTLIITAKNVLSKRYDVVVDGLKSVTGANIDKYEATITIAADKTAPTILGTERVSATQVKVKFSEPMKAFNNVTFKYADGSAVTGISGKIAVGAEEVVFTMTNAVTANKEIIATFIGAQDQAGNLITPNPATVTFTKGVADGVAPTVAAIAQTGAKTFAVKFSEALNGKPTIAIDGTPVATENVVQDTNDAANYIVTVSEVLAGAKTIKVSAFTDLSGEAGTDISKVVAFVKDADAPKVVSRAVVTDSSNLNEYLEITFDKDVKLDNATIDATGGSYVKDYVTTNLANRDITPKAIDYKDTSNKRVIRVPLAVFLGTKDFKGATYTLDLKLTNVTSVSSVPVDVVNATFTRGQDGTPANTKVVGVSQVQQGSDNHKVEVTFDQAIDGASAIDPANYQISSAIVESVKLNPVAADGKQVAVLNLKAGSNNFTGVRNITIENVKALGSTKTMETFQVSDVSLNENIAPTVTSARLTKTNEVTLTFSEAVNASNVSTDFGLLIGGATVATNDKVTTSAGAAVTSVVLTLEANVTNENIASGLSLEALKSLDIVDAAGNKLLVPTNISVTQ
ncbi:S-layer homology domain-containing protein [Sporosarcina sp. FSL K6-1508]|uniref:S-layer homology domain-containing protein n=1 Tax=Sporosarcina sp. FSL K6-1508 TaxID=2921553 RepID=UPI0030F52C0D